MGTPQKKKYVHNDGKDLVEEILAKELVANDSFSQYLLELLPTLCSYEEEGTKISPHLLIGKKLDGIFEFIPNRNVICIITGKVDGSDLKKRIKSLARFCCNGWSIFVNIDDKTVQYGIIRSFSGPKGLTLVDQLSIDSIDGQSFIYVYPESSRELIIFGNETSLHHIVFSFSSSQGVEDDENLDMMSLDFCSKSDPQHRESLQKAFLKLFRLFPQRLHGTIILLVENTDFVENDLADGIYLPDPIDLGTSAIAAIVSKGPSIEEYYGFTGLLLEMLNTDGITILTTDSKIIAYNVFINSNVDLSRFAGGARRRAAEALLHLENENIRGVYFQSQDGNRFYRSNQSNGKK